MLTQLIIGGAAILLNMGIMVGIIGLAMTQLRNLPDTITRQMPLRRRFFLIFASAVVVVVIANTICIWVWALLFLALQVFSQFEESLYFAITSYTTVGYGDIVVGKEWRILSGFISVNGLLAFGIATAFLFEVMRELSNTRSNRKLK